MSVFGMVTTSETSRYTDVALDTFFKTTFLKKEDLVFVIDNNATYKYDQCYSNNKINMIVNAAPLSFAENVNQIMLIAKQKKMDLFFLNNDIAFTSNWIEPMLIDEPSVICPLCNVDMQYKSSSFSLNNVIDLDNYLGNELEIENIVQKHKEQFKGFINEFHTAFFCVKIPYSIYKVIGEFDTIFGIGGGEDTDYCIRCYLAGFQIKRALNSYVIHFEGRSTWRGPETKKEQYLRTMKYKKSFQKKWGRNLLKLTILGDPTPLDSMVELREKYELKQYKYIIKCLMKQDNIQYSID